MMATPLQAIHQTPMPTPPPPELEQIFRQYADTVYRTALRVTGRPEEAEDVRQTLFLRLLNQHDRFDASSASPAYFRRAATNASIDILRRRASKAEAPLEENRDHATRENTYLLKESLRRALAKLDPEDAALFLLRYVEGHANKDLAVEFNIEPGTVASRLFRIRQVLQQEVEQ
jgi:RNA polymerase sigma factor (sigma-70 family)